MVVVCVVCDGDDGQSGGRGGGGAKLIVHHFCCPATSCGLHKMSFRYSLSHVGQLTRKEISRIVTLERAFSTQNDHQHMW